MGIVEREHQKFEDQIVGLKSRLSSPLSEWFLKSVLGVLRGDSKFWSDVSVEHSQAVVDTALAVLRSGVVSIPRKDTAMLTGFFDYKRDSDDG
jgi:hypothetical protein